MCLANCQCVVEGDKSSSMCYYTVPHQHVSCIIENAYLYGTWQKHVKKEKFIWDYFVVNTERSAKVCVQQKFQRKAFNS